MLARRAIKNLWPDRRPFFVETERMMVVPLKLSELIDHMRSGGVLNEDDKEYAASKFVPELIDMKSNNYVFHTFWTAVPKGMGHIVWADFMFHSEPWQGRVEIGYKTRHSMQNQGIATEVLAGMIKWARKQADIKILVAAPESTASERVLEKNGFIRKNKIFELKLK